MYILKNAVKSLLLAGFVLGVSLSAIAQTADSAAVQSSLDSVGSPAKPKSGIKVTGTVKESSTNRPLAGISISIPGYSAAITDDNGAFSIAVPNFDGVIVASGQGFQAKEIALKGRNNVQVRLYESAFNSVYETVNLPFGSRRKNHLPYSAQSVNVDDNWSRKSEAPDSYIQGKVAGLDAIRRSGTPGIGSNLFLRGFNSLYTTNRPLIVVDGMIYDNSEYGSSLIGNHFYNSLQDIELKDIDNITVLKDAAAGMYGTRSANGVILITTVRAKEQVTKIDFGAYGGLNNRVASLPVMNDATYRTYLSDLSKTRGLSDDQIRSLPYMNDDNSVSGGLPNNPEYYRYHQNTSWQDQVLNTGISQNYYLKVTGGDNIATYGLTVGYLKDEGIVRSTDLRRYQTRFNADLNLTKSFTATANLSFASNEQNLRDQGLFGKTNPLYLSQVKAPFLHTNAVSDVGAVSPNLADVDIFNFSNPVSALEDMQGVNKNYRFFGSVGLKYELNKFAAVQTLLGLNFDKVREKLFVPDKGIVGDTVDNAIVYNRSGSNVERLFGLYNDTRLSFNRVYDNTHFISANLGFRYNVNNSENDYGLGYNSATDEFVSVTSGQASLRKVSGSKGKWNWLNNYLNVDYGLKNKYFLNFNLAVDGSSRFGKEAPGSLEIFGNKYAVLPSLSAAWLLSSEKFFNLPSVESLKLRASYGLTGNDDIGNYTAKQWYTSQNLLGIQGLVRANVGNPRLKWETVKKANFGIDGSLLNERLSFTVDLFSNKTEDMFMKEAASAETGFNFVYTNNGSMRTKGVDFGLNGRLFNKTNFKWDMGLNLSRYRNAVLLLPNGPIYTSFGDATFVTSVGQPANLFYGHKTNGIYTTNSEAEAAGLGYKLGGSRNSFVGGDVKFSDLDGNKLIDERDRQVIGNPNPDFIGSYNNSLSWKRWSLDALFTFSVGNDIYNYTRSNLESMSGFENQTEIVKSRWRVDGQQTHVPRAAFGDPAGNSRFSDRWIEDGSYLRLRNVSVAYSYPIKDSALKYARVYLSGSNMFTLTKYLGYDPEFSAAASIFGQGVDAGLEPVYRSVQLGVRIGL